VKEFPVSLDTLITFVRTIHPEGGALEALSDAVRVSGRVEEQADALIGHFVDQARRSGSSWSQIGESMGVSKQAAQQRFVARPGGMAPGQRMFERFAPRARNALVMARRLAAEDDSATETEPRHLVGGLLSEPDGIACLAVAALGVEVADVYRVLSLPPLPRRLADAASPADVQADLPGAAFGTEAKETIANALDVALHYRHNYIGTEHLILAAAAQGPAAGPLEAAGLELERLRAEVERQIETVRASARSGDNAQRET
jgi:hypothetical protein